MTVSIQDPPRWRRPLVYTAALVVALALGATTVFLMGSANRRSDKAALLEYERALLPLVREGGRIVQQEMKPTLGELAEGTIDDRQLSERADAWQAVFERVRSELLALTPPPFLAEIEEGLSTAMGGYLLAVDAFRAITRTDPSGRDAAIAGAATFGERADDLFDRAAGVIQFHRRRLGLDPSPDLPDPAANPSG